MANYLKASPTDHDDIVDFGNYVFKTDFKSLLPKLYNGQIDTTSYHFLVKEAEKIKAMVGSFPLELNVLGETLHGFGIGTVSVHPYSRSKGYMKTLMQNAMDEMYEEHADFAILSGQKQRYEYFGFTPSGVKVCFTVNSTNLKHKGIQSEGSLVLKSFDTISPDELTQLHQMHHSKPLHSTRILEHFITICKTWESKAYALYNEDRLSGYIILSDQAVQDFYICTPHLLGQVLATVMKDFSLDELYLSIGNYEHAYLTYLLDLCENYQVCTATSLNILNYHNFISAFLKFKQTYVELEKGQLVLEIQNREKLLIEVGEAILITPTTLSPDISLSHPDAIHLLCDPIQVFAPTLLAKQRLVSSWFPLPFTYCPLDNV